MLSLPAVRSLGSANNLNGATSIIAGQFQLARQLAIALNCKVDVRLYLDTECNPPVARSVQIVQLRQDPSDADQPLRRIAFLPQGIIIANKNQSSLMDQTVQKDGNNKSYVSLTFCSIGSISPLSTSGLWDICLVAEKEYVANSYILPNNWTKLTFSTLTGALQVGRP